MQAARAPHLASAECVVAAVATVAAVAMQGTDNEQADCVQQAGIWALSVSNNFIGNRCVHGKHTAQG